MARSDELLGFAVLWISLVAMGARCAPSAQPPVCLSPSALALTQAGDRLYIACPAAKRVLCLDTRKGTLQDAFDLAGSPSGLALSRDESRLFVTCAAARSEVVIVSLTNSPVGTQGMTQSRSVASNPRKMKGGARPAKAGMLAAIPAGHTAKAPLLGANGRILYVCNRFDNDVSILDLDSESEIGRLPARREPVASAVTSDGRHLLVANCLHSGRADMDSVAATVTVIDLVTDSLERDIRLPNGSGVLSDLRLSPDGHYAAVPHLVASFKRAASQVKFGWMNANALSILDARKMVLLFTVLLDSPHQGAANPSAVAWSADGATLLVAHAGTHEVSVIDFPNLLQRATRALAEVPRQATPVSKTAGSTNEPIFAFAARYEGLDAGLPFLAGARQRIKLPNGDLGPRAIAMAGHIAFVANYFSDTLTVIDLSATPPSMRSVDLREGLVTEPGRTQPAGGGHRERETVLAEMTLERRGEFYFHDATICLEGWQSCASCHPGDARTDGLNWDLLNDGIGNPKNTKSLLLAHRTPPAMSLGVRGTAETAVRAGIEHILFNQQPEGVAAAIDAYLKTLKPVPSPHLLYPDTSTPEAREHPEGLPPGQPSNAARRGQIVFLRADCARCHPPDLYTDLHSHDVGTSRGFDKPTDKFDTPTLIELWRTAPYLHDGSAVSVRDVLTARNPRGLHGHTSALTSQDLDDLCAYLLSL